MSGSEETVLRIAFEGNKGTPALAQMVVALLKQAGAVITSEDDRIDLCGATGLPKSLKGLHVHVDRITWVRDEEIDRLLYRLQDEGFERSDDDI